MQVDAVQRGRDTQAQFNSSNNNSQQHNICVYVLNDGFEHYYHILIIIIRKERKFNAVIIVLEGKEDRHVISPTLWCECDREHSFVRLQSYLTAS